MPNDGKVVINIEADDSQFRDTVDDLGDEAKDAADGVDKLNDSTKDAGKGFDIANIACGNFIANGITKLISGLGNAVSSIFELAESTRDYRDDMAKLETAFTSAGHKTETASKAYDDFYAILGESDRSVEAVNHLAELTKNEEELAKWSTIAAGVTAKFGDSLPIEGLTEAANETAKVGAVTGPLADALNWAGIKEDEFNAKLESCTSEQERATLITETLNGLYADAADEYNELTGSTQDARRATSDMEKAQAELGKAVEPLTTKITELKAKALEALAPVVQTCVEKLNAFQAWMEENPEKAVIVKGVILAVAAALGVLTVAVGAAMIVKMLTTAFAALNAVMAMNPIILIVAAVAALVAGFIYLWKNCEGFRQFWINLWDGIKSVIAAVVDWVKENWKTLILFLLNPVAGIFKYIWDHCEGFRTALTEFFTNIWSAISGFFATIWRGISVFFVNVWNGITNFTKKVWEIVSVDIPNIVKNVVQWVADLPVKIWMWLVETVNRVVSWGKNMATRAHEAASGFVNKAITTIKELPGKVWTWLTTTIQKAAEFVTSLGKKGVEAAAELVTNIINGAKELPAKMLEIGKNVVSGVWKGIIEAKDKFFSDIKGFFSGLVKGAKDALDINSPSKKFQYIGNMIVLGLVKGIQETKAKAKSATKKVAEDIYDAAIDAQEEYKEKVLDIESDLADSMESLTEKYYSTLESRTNSLFSALGLFDEFEIESASVDKMTTALSSQVDALTRYNAAMEKLKGRGVSTLLYEQLQNAGVNSLAEIEALASATDDALAKYDSMLSEKYAIARESALNELSGMRAEMRSQVFTLVKEAYAAIGEAEKVYAKQLKELGLDAAANLIITNAKNTGESAAIGLRDTMLDITKDSGYRESLNSIGENFIDGISAGMENEATFMYMLVRDISQNMVKAMTGALDINSPSGVTRDIIGKNMAAGIGVGFKDKIADVKKNMQRDLSGLVAKIKTTVLTENASAANTVGAPDTGLSDLARAVGVQTAGINSLAGQYRTGAANKRPIILQLDKRELGRAVIDTGTEEATRLQISLA